MADKFASVGDIATRLGVSHRTVRTFLNTSDDPLPSFKVGGRRRVRERDFESWIERRRFHPANPDEIADAILSCAASRSEAHRG